MFRQGILLVLVLTPLSLDRAQQPAPSQLFLGPDGQLTHSPATNAPATHAPAPSLPPVNGSPSMAADDPVTSLLHQAYQLMQQQQLDAALAKVNAALQMAPKNPNAYELRATIYVGKKLLDQAGKDYETAHQIDGKNKSIDFDLAELQFMQKKYDGARPGFAALKQDPLWGDLAAYKVFLCDLFGGHEDAAAKELDDFNRIGRNTSYYFAHAAWSLYHHKTEEGRGWLTSAAYIYAPDKIGLYTTSLIQLGYLPLPPPH